MELSHHQFQNEVHQFGSYKKINLTNEFSISIQIHPSMYVLSNINNKKIFCGIYLHKTSEGKI